MNVVITDRRIVSSPAPGASIWEAVVISTSDYYPFGMEMPGRQNVDQLSGPVPVPLPVSYNLDYRYAYNGMETDGEVSGDGNSYTTEFRQYDPRLGRWLSLDPLMHMFPSMSPYCAFDNNPVYFVDPMGLASTGADWDKDQAEKKAARMRSKGYENVIVKESTNPDGSPSGNFGVFTTGKKNGSGYGHYFEGGNSHKKAMAKINNEGSNHNSFSFHGGTPPPIITPEQAAALQGGADALTNAHTLGSSDASGLTENSGKFSTHDEYVAYMAGRLGGDAASIIIGVSEFLIGVGGAIATSPTIVGAVGGTALAGYGGSVVVTSSVDLVETALALSKTLTMNGGSGTEDSEGLGESSNGKNEKHGDGGRTETKSQKQLRELEEKLKNASGNEAKKIKQKIKNITEAARRAKKGEEHSRANKR